MNKDEINTLKANGVKWFKGMNLTSTEYEGVWIKLPSNGCTDKHAVFVHNSRLLHLDEYDYSKVEYVNWFAPVTIICPKHGEFEQAAGSHLKGFGCRKCAQMIRADENRSTLEKFINRARVVHGSKYDYSKAEYVNIYAKITISCPNHGEFEQSSSNHLSGKGCVKCADLIRANQKRSTPEEYIERANAVHGNKYDYSKVEYVNWSTNITIICPKHGEFEQMAGNHLKGCGCSQCKRVIEPLTQLYLVRYKNKKNNQSYYKIGFTGNASGLRAYTKTTLSNYSITLEDAFIVDTIDARMVERLLLAAARSIYGEVTCTDIIEGRIDGKTEMIPYDPQLLNDFEEWAEMYEKLE